jgi:single-strand DNA-binding protein
LNGNVGDDPRTNEHEGSPVANFSLATNSYGRDNDGERVTFTEWHQCAVWGLSVPAFVKHVAKGTGLLVEGRLRTKKTERDGVTFYNTTVIVERWEVQTRRNDADDDTPTTTDEEAA